MTEPEYISCVYHELFNYTLSKTELKKWRAGKKLVLRNKHLKNISRKISIEQNKNKLASAKKREMAENSALLLSKIPFILFVGITGSLAMNNAKTESDIDFMIITKSNTLWLSRLIALFLLPLNNNKVRKARNNNEQDKICLNLWIDENAFSLPGMPHTAYTAHEVAQVIPLVNKNKTYEKWLFHNKWVQSYWPNAIAIRNIRMRKVNTNIFVQVLNNFCYVIQRIYMNNKITRERVTVHTAYFHPFDWGEKIKRELQRNGIVESVI